MRKVSSGVLSVLAAGTLLFGACAEDVVAPEGSRTIAVTAEDPVEDPNLDADLPGADDADTGGAGGEESAGS